MKTSDQQRAYTSFIEPYRADGLDDSAVRIGRFALTAKIPKSRLRHGKPAVEELAHLLGYDVEMSYTIDFPWYQPYIRGSDGKYSDDFNIRSCIGFDTLKVDFFSSIDPGDSHRRSLFAAYSGAASMAVGRVVAFRDDVKQILGEWDTEIIEGAFAEHAEALRSGELTPFQFAQVTGGLLLNRAAQPDFAA